MIDFIGDGVGGDVVPINLNEKTNKINGSSVDVFIFSDGNNYTARNGEDAMQTNVGNVLYGFFCLKLRIHRTEKIPYNDAVSQNSSPFQILELSM